MGIIISPLQWIQLLLLLFFFVIKLFCQFKIECPTFLRWWCWWGEIKIKCLYIYNINLLKYILIVSERVRKIKLNKNTDNILLIKNKKLILNNNW